jgi:hypothetical protein
MTETRAAIFAVLASQPGQPVKALRQYGWPHSNKWGYAPYGPGPIEAFDDRDVRELYVNGFLDFVDDSNGGRCAVLTGKAAQTAGAALPAYRHEPAAVRPYTFEQLLDHGGKQDVDLIFHVHVPKAGGKTVSALLRQNDFLNLDFDMNTRNFFEVVPEDRFFDTYRRPPPRKAYALTGHFRLDHPMLRRAWMPHLIVTTLRDPIRRMLSHYNYTIRVPGNPCRDEVIKGMSFLEYAKKALAAFGPQYGFFDDTGQGSFAPTGNATPEECLHNLMTKVGLFGLTDRFDEFAALFGYLVRRRNVLALPNRNVTDEIENPIDMPSKVA